MVFLLFLETSEWLEDDFLPFGANFQGQNVKLQGAFVKNPIRVAGVMIRADG